MQDKITYLRKLELNPIAEGLDVIVLAPPVHKRHVAVSKWRVVATKVPDLKDFKWSFVLSNDEL